MARVGADETAFPHRDKRYLTLLVGLWMDPAEDRVPHEDWTEGLWTKIRHDADGVYVNFLENEGDERIREAYGDSNLARLAWIKAKYDPDNFFCYNQNIRPQS
jgi:hypothetical protein